MHFLCTYTETSRGQLDHHESTLVMPDEFDGDLLELHLHRELHRFFTANPAMSGVIP
jgi:hypothetical protein